MDKLGWFAENSEQETHPVREKDAPNTWGLLGMHGNVWEWCLDGPRKYTDKEEINPLGPLEESALRVIRGGSWSSHAQDCRSAYRSRVGPGDRWHFRGLRLAAVTEHLTSPGVIYPFSSGNRSSGTESPSRLIACFFDTTLLPHLLF